MRILDKFLWRFDLWSGPDTESGFEKCGVYLLIVYSIKCNVLLRASPESESSNWQIIVSNGSGKLLCKI
jgi:hypothetical protein